MNAYNETAVMTFSALVRQQYTEANRVPDAFYPVWVARTVYDYCGGLSWEKSSAKHLRELRVALGLPVPDPPTPPAVKAPILDIVGVSFIDDETTRIWPWRSVTAFPLFQRWLDGDMASVRTWTAWMRRNQIRMARVLGMYHGGLGRFVPAEYPSYWRGMPEFFELMRDEGFALEFTIFADAQTDLLKTIDQADHYAKVRDAVAPFSHVVIELCNEPFKNGVDVAALWVKDPRVVQATGDYSETDMLAYPVLDFITIHTPRDDEWPRKAKHLLEAAEARKVPCVGDEPMGIGRILPPPASQQRSLVASDHAQYHALCSLQGAGSTIHGTFANQLRLPDAEEQLCVTAIVESWNIIPPEVHESWHYTRAGLSTSPLADTGSLRTYAMVSPDGQHAWAVEVRPRSEKGEDGVVRPVPPKAAPGWRIVGTHGYEGCVIECAR